MKRFFVEPVVRNLDTLISQKFGLHVICAITGTTAHVKVYINHHLLTSTFVMLACSLSLLILLCNHFGYVV